MRIKGSVEIQRIDSVTGEVKEIIKQDNLIPNDSLVGVLDFNATNNYFGGLRISISTSTATPSAGVSTLPNIIATGGIPAGVTSPTWNETIDPPFGQIQNRIGFTGVSRVFNSVGLTALSSQAYAYLKLDTPCTQGVSEYLDIYYRIQFVDVAGYGFLNSKTARYDFGKRMFGVTDSASFRISYDMANPFNNPANTYNNLFAGIDAGLAGYGFINPSTFAYTVILGGTFYNSWTSQTKVNNHYKYKYFRALTKADFNGTIFNLILKGVSNSNYTAYSKAKFKYFEEPFQTGFWHGSTATAPFFDTNTPASSNGKINMSGVWLNKWPELYKFTITTSGASGVAAYKFSVRRHLGFTGNNYVDRVIPNPFRNPNVAAAPNQHGWREENNDVLRWSSTKIVQYDDTGITLLDLFDGTYTNWDATTTPTLAATQIRQVAVDPGNNKIYVGCRLTGLYIIDVTANTVTLQLNNPCYGVDVGRNGVVVALISGGLYRSTDWTTPTSFAWTGITDSNWSRVWFLKADPENINDQIAIAADNGSGANRIVWWQASDNASTLGYQGSEIKKYPASLDVSDTGSFWATNASKFTFGSATRTALSWGAATQSLTHSVFGLDNYYKIDFYKGNLICADRLVSSADASVVTYTNWGASSFLLHMDSGITLGSTAMRQLFTDNVYCWTDYFWNGSAWVTTGSTGSKVTHTTDQALVNGLQVKFTDGANAPHFTSTNYLTQGICYGMWKDNATDATWQSAWYSVPARLAESVNLIVPIIPPYTVTLLATIDPLFIRVETDSPELHAFTLNGVPVTKVYVDGSVPAPGEISMAASGDGVLTFNSLNAGATLAGTYAWIGF